MFIPALEFKNDVQRLIDVYRRNGRFAVTVEPKVIQLPQNRVDLIFEITEGPVTEIRRIGFVGNVKYSDSDLRSVVRTKETAWYRFLTADDIYDPDRLTFESRTPSTLLFKQRLCRFSRRISHRGVGTKSGRFFYYVYDRRR